MTETNGEARNGQSSISQDRFLHEIGEIVGNLMLSRSQLWSTLLDRRRRIDEECDYPPTGMPIGVDLYKELYEREAIAARVVEVMPMESWQVTPQIADGKDIEEETEFEKAWDELGKTLAPGGGTSWHREEHGSVVWEYLRRLDILSGIGQFGVLLLGIDDGLNLQDPVDGSTVAVGVTNDSPLSESEEAELRKLGSTPKQIWTHNHHTRVKNGLGMEVEGPAIPQYREIPVQKLNSEELAVVNQWRDCREVHNAFKRIALVLGGPASVDQVLNVATDSERPLVERWIGLAERAHAVWNSFCPTGPGGGIDATCSPGGGTDPHSLGARGEGTKENPYRCGSDIKLAAKLLAQGHHIELSQPEQVATLMDRLDKMARKAAEKGEAAPKIDLCKVSAPHSNLFCQESLGIPRVQMPQMRGKPVPGTYAATKEASKKTGKVDLTHEFLQHLADNGIKSEQTSIRASHLRASQNEIDGSRVGQLIDEAKAGTRDLREKPIFVTRDNYIVDGHHHWAAIVGEGYGRNKDLKVPVYKLDMDIGRALTMANEFTKVKGLAPKSVPTANKTATNFQDLLPGTDRQYFEAGSLGMGMSQALGSGALGTDRQYLGVQFGPSQKAVDKPIKQHKLLFVRCYDESLVQVVRYEWNVMNPRFGMPVMYRITLNDPRQIHSGIGLPLATVFVHWTRVIHVADNLTNSEIFGTPRMQQVLNRCLDLRKLYAAGAEGYWQSCFAAISLETHPQAGGDIKIDEKATAQQLSDFRNRLRRDLLLEGMSAKMLPPSVIDGSPFITSQIEAICIKIPCPKRVFMGSERGELASSQDDAQWNDVIRARQNLHVTPRIIVPFVNRLILLGVLPEPEDGFKVDWPDLDSLNDKDKAAVGLTITQAIAAFVAGNGEAVISIKDFLVKVFSGFFTEEEVDAIIEEAEKKQEEDLADKQALADQHGMIPEPPQGFQHPPPPPPPATPIKIKAGEKLVHPESVTAPASGKPPSGNPPTGDPATGKPPTRNEAAEYIEAKIKFDQMLEELP